MAKSKTEAAVKPASPAVANGVQNGQKKKKKNDPLRPQPTWLFPDDEDNPVLNGKVKSDAEVEKETKERLAAIDFLKHRSVTAPVKDAPDGLLMQLIGAFLTSYGFHSTSRVFTLEREARVVINGWEDQLGKKFDKSQPSLVQIFKRWQREWQLEQAEVKAAKGDETSSDEGEDAESSADEKPAKKAKGVKKASKDSDSSSSDSDSDSDDAAKPARPTKKTATSTPAKKRKSPASDSDSDSDSDSSSEDESDAPVKKRKVEENGKGSKKVTTTQQVNGVKAKETVKATPSKVEKTTVVAAAADSSDDSEDDSDSDSDSSTEGDANPNGVAVTTNGKSTPNGKKAKKVASSDDDSDSDSSSDSSSDDEQPAKSKKVDTPTQASTTQKRKRSKSPAATSTPVSAAKVAKKSNEPFSRIPKDQFVDPRLSSNKYVPYDYAQRAHEDLIVTKGKGFTKEKNKKKRGSYRGGAIDLGGGKGIKFDD